MTLIRPLAEADLPESQRIVRVALATFLGAPDSERFWSDLDYVYGRFGAEHTAAFAAENDGGALVGSNFATRWGSVGLFGPLTTRPDLWDGGIGQRLVAAACDQSEPGARGSVPADGGARLPHNDPGCHDAPAERARLQRPGLFVLDD